MTLCKNSFIKLNCSYLICYNKRCCDNKIYKEGIAFKNRLGKADKLWETGINHNFLQGAFILTLAGFIVKLLGALQAAIARIIEDEGMGLYQMAYPIYIALLSISTAGIPTAISKMVEKELGEIGNHTGF